MFRDDVGTKNADMTTLEGKDVSSMDFPKEQGSLGESQIQKMFAGSSVFLTGGTGFLGKLLIEKLLRSCPDLKKFYMLARPKKGKDTSKRIQEQFDDVLYDRLRKEMPDFKEKVVVVEGDVGEIGLAMNEEDRIKIMNEVEFIFHGAATVRFDEPLKSAVEINVRGTREVFQLARACRKLRAVVHISTAFCHSMVNPIEEKFYNAPVSGDQLIGLVEAVDEEIIKDITPGMIKGYDNTYACTKDIAEGIVLKYSKGLPVAVVRPSIVIGTYKEPVPGWIDNIYGPTGMVVGAGVGLLHAVNADPKAIADMVPGDYVVNSCIAAAWKVAKEQRRNHEEPLQDSPPPIYNYVSNAQNRIHWGQFRSFTETHGLAVPTVHAIYAYLFIMTASKTLYKIYCLLLHWLPAYVIDGVLMLIGKKPMLKKIYTKASNFCDAYTYFSTQSWTIFNNNTQNLFAELCDADKKIFDFDMSKLDWDDYFYNYVRGVRVFLVKDPLETIPEGIRRQKRLNYLHLFICTVLGLGLLRLFWAIFSIFI